jgi:hypothetical protein
MKKKPSRKLQARTGSWAPRAAKSQLLISDRSRKVASPRAAPAPEVLQPIFRGRDWSKLPKINFDSTLIISEERDAR